MKVYKKSIFLFLIYLTSLIVSCSSPLKQLREFHYSQDNRKKIFILSSENFTSFQMVKQTLQHELSSNYEILFLNLEGNYEEPEEIAGEIKNLHPDLIICIGSHALETLIGKIKETPILFSMILDHKQFNISKYTNITGVSLDIQPESIFYNYKSAIGEVTKVGVIVSQNYYYKALLIQKKLAQMNIQLLIYKSSANKVLESYQAIKDKIDVLWMLPDPSVINDNNFLYLAEKTIEDKLPFIVYSENFVKAGGLFSISPNYSTVGSQLAIMVKSSGGFSFSKRHSYFSYHRNLSYRKSNCIKESRAQNK